MELWIRSQDKNLLIEVYGISLFQKTIFASNKECKEFILGTYSTEKRALEVLDEIQKLLMPTYKFIANKDLDGNDIKVYGVEYINSYVYEMPEE